MRGLGVLIALTAAGLVCAGCPTRPEVDVDAKVREIRELDRAWLAAFEAKDVEGAMQFFAPDAVLMPANGPAIVGREAIAAWYELWLPNPLISSSFWPVVVEVAASGELAYDRGTFESTMETPDGRIRNVGKYVVVWKLSDGEWKAILDISNSDLASPQLLAHEVSEVKTRGSSSAPLGP